MILFDPLPRRRELIFNDNDWQALAALGELHEAADGQKMTDSEVDALLPNLQILLGQTDMPKQRLDKAPKLKAIINVEGNFLPNIDYETCFDRGIHVLSTSPVFAEPVAEMALALGLNLARGVSPADQAMRKGSEAYGFAANQNAGLFHGSRVGIIGYGDLGRAFRPLVRPFKCPVSIYDPWLPDHVIEADDCEPASLERVLSQSDFVFVFAAVTTENRHFLGREELSRLKPGSSLLIMSRAEVVDFDILIEMVNAGRFKAATDVFPEEPMPQDHPCRSCEGLLLSTHRAGALAPVYKRMGSIITSDTTLILQGQQPVSCKPARRDTVSRLRSVPVHASTQTKAS